VRLIGEPLRRTREGDAQEFGGGGKLLLEGVSRLRGAL